MTNTYSRRASVWPIGLGQRGTPGDRLGAGSLSIVGCVGPDPSTAPSARTCTRPGTGFATWSPVGLTVRPRLSFVRYVSSPCKDERSAIERGRHAFGRS
jgi:hypothetical protein